MTNKKDCEHLKMEIDAVLKQYATEYQTLAEHSEKQTMTQEALKKAYEDLDRKTGLNALFERLSRAKQET